MPHRQIQLHTVPGLWPPTWPMGLTTLRLLLLPVFLWLILIDAGAEKGSGTVVRSTLRPVPATVPDPFAAPRPHRWWAVGIFAVMAITDKLDGYLARRLNQTSKLGTILDPVADKLLVACSVILLSFDWIALPRFRIPTIVVVAIYGKDLIVATGTISLLAVVGKVTIWPRPLGRLSTVLQLALVMATLTGADLEYFGAAVPQYLLHGLWWSVTLVAVAACTDYVVQGFRQFYAARAAAPSVDRTVPPG